MKLKVILSSDYSGILHPVNIYPIDLCTLQTIGEFSTCTLHGRSKSRKPWPIITNYVAVSINVMLTLLQILMKLFAKDISGVYLLCGST